MVCVPCFIIPLLLYIWHKFVQPILLRYWNPWEKKDAEGKVIKKGPEFPFECKGGVCPYVPGAKKTAAAAAESESEANPDNPEDLKSDPVTTTKTITTTTTTTKTLTTTQTEETKKEI